MSAPLAEAVVRQWVANGHDAAISVRPARLGPRVNGIRVVEISCADIVSQKFAGAADDIEKVADMVIAEIRANSPGAPDGRHRPGWRDNPDLPKPAPE